MIDNTFIQSPEYQDYLDNKEEISKESVVFVEDKERLITQDKEYQFVPSGGTEGQILHKTENGVEWKDNEGGGDTKITWTVLLDDSIETFNKTLIIGDNKFKISGKELAQIDANRTNVVSEFINNLPETLTFTNGKALTGYEDYEFNHYVCTDESILNGALVITSEGLFIHDGSDYENFEGVIVSIPGYEYELEGELSVELSSFTPMLISKKGSMELEVDESTAEGRAFKTIMENYNGNLVFSSTSTYYWECCNFKEICQKVEEKIEDSLEIDYNNYTLAIPLFYFNDTEYTNFEILEARPVFDQMNVPYNAGIYLSIIADDLTGFSTNIKVANFTYDLYCKVFDDIALEYVDKNTSILGILNILGFSTLCTFKELAIEEVYSMTNLNDTVVLVHTDNQEVIDKVLDLIKATMNDVFENNDSKVGTTGGGSMIAFTTMTFEYEGELEPLRRNTLALIEIEEFGGKILGYIGNNASDEDLLSMKGIILIDNLIEILLSDEDSSDTYLFDNNTLKEIMDFFLLNPGYKTMNINIKDTLLIPKPKIDLSKLLEQPKVELSKIKLPLLNKLLNNGTELI